MTLSSLRAVENQIDELKQLLSSEPQSEETRAFLASLSPAEIDQMTEIFIRHNQVDDLPFENLTPDEIAFLEPLFEREVQVVPIIRGEPVCQCCGCQPATERGDLGEHVFWCDRCWQQTCPGGP